jgi:hypothetical protein
MIIAYSLQKLVNSYKRNINEAIEIRIEIRWPFSLLSSISVVHAHSLKYPKPFHCNTINRLKETAAAVFDSYIQHPIEK